MRLPPLILALLTLTLPACHPSSTPPSPSAATSQSAPRIASLVPAATLNLLLIGAGNRLVAVSEFDRTFLPDNLRNLPVVGNYTDIYYETLLTAQPTVLILQQEESRIPPKLRQLAADHHIDLLNIHLESVADIWTTTRALGHAAGAELRADQAIALARQQLQDLADRYARDPHKPRILYLTTPRSMMIVGAHSILDEMITLAGGENAGALVGTGFPIIDREAIVRLAPDVLLLGAPSEPPQQSDDPRLRTWMTLTIPATRDHRVFLITDSNSQMASVDIGRNVQLLADLIHRPPTPATGGPP